MPREEIMPGVYVGSEAGDIDREMQRKIAAYMNGDTSALDEIHRLSQRRCKILARVGSRRALNRKER